MISPNPQVDPYFLQGCGRCPLGGTPDCKVHRWPEELRQLRRIALECGLKEELKWGVPCYTYRGSSIAVVAAFKDYSSLSFFKGALLQDSDKLLDKPGENSQSARMIKFTDFKRILAMETTLKAYLFEAIEIEKSGLKVEFSKQVLAIPEELQTKFDQFPALKPAFESLTPGRQKGYILHFSQPKQLKTRESRIEKCLPQILSGKGLND
jgi:uncharacterized protein YdeI (YjbR/CyaY-like superfamily)